MKTFLKYLLATVIVLIVVFVVVFNSYQKEKEVIFSASDSSVSEDAEGRLVLEATITNRGDTPIEIEGCGYYHAGCDEDACEGIGVVNPMDEFIVNVICDAGVNSEEVRLSGFYIRNRARGEGESRTTSSGTSLFPSFNPSGASSTSRSSSSGSSRSSSPSTQPGTTNPTIGGNTGTTSPGGNTGTGTNPGAGTQIPTTLGSPAFVEISGSSNRANFIIGDNTPTIQADVPGLTSLGINCRWSSQDLSFSSMPPGNSCVIDVGEGLISCNLPQQTEGLHTYSVACSDGSRQNGPANNLDLSGTIDSINPVITSVSPYTNTAFSSGVNNFVLYFNTNENSQCVAVAGSQAVNCGGGLSHSCTISLGAEGSTILVDLTCLDLASNEVNINDLVYSRATSNSRGSPKIPQAPNSGGSTSDAGTVEGGDGSAGKVDVVADVGGVVRDFDSEHNLFDGIIDWFKNLFN